MGCLSGRVLVLPWKSVLVSVSVSVSVLLAACPEMEAGVGPSFSVYLPSPSPSCSVLGEGEEGESLISTIPMPPLSGNTMLFSPSRQHCILP